MQAFGYSNVYAKTFTGQMSIFYFFLEITGKRPPFVIAYREKETGGYANESLYEYS
jgi:hypothetical protein